MGEARAKKLAGIPRSTERRQPPPKPARRAYLPIEVETDDGRKYEVHVDGSVYELIRPKGYVVSSRAPRPVRRVHDPEVIAAAQKLAVEWIEGRRRRRPPARKAAP